MRVYSYYFNLRVSVNKNGIKESVSKIYHIWHSSIR
jgi:proteasome assembly chaperone (PAC2) family protein